MKKVQGALLLVLLAVLISAVSLAWPAPDGAEQRFAGTDDQARAIITQIDPRYKPWFDSLWVPPGPQVESLLFALQAALGAGMIGYYFGFVRGRAQGRKQERQHAPD